MRNGNSEWEFGMSRLGLDFVRDRLTAGRDALNVVVLVRIQLSQLIMEVIRLDEEPVLKTGGASALVGSSPTASAWKQEEGVETRT